MLISEVELQRKYLYRKFGDLILRPYLTFKYEPLTADKIKVLYVQKPNNFIIRKEAFFLGKSTHRESKIRNKISRKGTDYVFFVRVSFNCDNNQSQFDYVTTE